MIQVIVGYTCRQLHQRIQEHKHSIIRKHFEDEHNLKLLNPYANFKILKKCQSKLEYLIFEILLNRKKRPKLNTQSDSIRAKLFVRTVSGYNFIIHILVIYTHTFSVYIYNDSYVNLSTFDNDDMRSSNRYVVFLSLMFLSKCILKLILILDSYHSIIFLFFLFYHLIDYLFNFHYIVQNRPFPSSVPPLFQGESTCKVFVINISLHSY